MHQKIAQILLYATYATMQPFWLAPPRLDCCANPLCQSSAVRSTMQAKGHKSMWLSDGSQKGRQQLADGD